MLELLVNISQMTAYQRLSLVSRTELHQQRLHRLSEHILNGAGLPVIHIWPTVFMENALFGRLAVASIQRDDTIRLPFGTTRTSPVAARDVAEVSADPRSLANLSARRQARGRALLAVRDAADGSGKCLESYVAVGREGISVLRGARRSVRGRGRPPGSHECGGGRTW